MKITYKLSGMSCMHCRAHVEKALNTIPGVKAIVTLSPQQAEIIYEGDEPLPLEKLQEVIEEEAGDYTISL
ncbi:MAG: heavy-metal-associated domain-containing protein [Muribaculum sp.]|nr:heavy-metal-associated domain-containing protein [Muribaculaceae bacterium]MCM1080630.1 heavy-metal-associated domain-containing protein [Muribaculum sp.]